jgi:hypothetical protein
MKTFLLIAYFLIPAESSRFAQKDGKARGPDIIDDMSRYYQMLKEMAQKLTYYEY